MVIGLNSEIIAYYKAGRNVIIKTSGLAGAIIVLLMLISAALFIFFIALNQPIRAIFALIVELVILFYIARSESK